MLNSRWEKSKIFFNRYFASPLAGITAGDWFRLLIANRFSIDPRYWLRAIIVTCSSFNNSIVGRQEEWRFGKRIDETKVKPPLFVLGHWRSGTTHLHNLLSVDQQFASPSTLDSSFPHTSLTTVGTQSRLIDFFLPKHRLMDHVSIRAGLPQEDEFALAILTLCSEYLGEAFPRRREHYERYLTFRDASAQEIDRWKLALLRLAKKLTWKYRRPLVFKSPPHTCRIRLLLDVFPDARFIHIHRDPIVVFSSTKHMNRIGMQVFRLQECGSDDLDTRIISRYRRMYDAFFEERGMIPAKRYCEIAFEELERDAIGQIRSIYDKLELPGFDAAFPRLNEYVESLKGYEKNQFPELPIELRARLFDAWRPCFEEWGYDHRSANA